MAGPYLLGPAGILRIVFADGLVVMQDGNELTLSAPVAAGTLPANVALTDAPNVFSQDQTITKARPALKLVTLGTTAGAHFSQAVANDVAITRNMNWDGANWNLDDTTLTGAILYLAGDGGLKYFTAPAAANPATITERYRVSSTGSLDVGSVPDARLTSNVALKNVNNLFTAAQRIGDGTTSAGLTIDAVNAANDGPLVTLAKASVVKAYMGLVSAILGGTSDDLLHYASVIRFVASGAAVLNLNGTYADLLCGQVKFPAAQVPSADANILDDYEEGTWTPIDSSGAALAFAAASGQYTKIGRAVHVIGTVSYPATASGAAALIGGLPFTAGANGSLAIGYQTEATLQSLLIASTTTAFAPYTSTGVQLTNVTLSNDTIQFAGTYFV